ncbi:right-handed parallel beta-helix repeat-containing protein [bacterium]|nr:right-handed parallel beta-helix repeat-containing protein [bacterium]
MKLFSLGKYTKEISLALVFFCLGVGLGKVPVLQKYNLIILAKRWIPIKKNPLATANLVNERNIIEPGRPYLKLYIAPQYMQKLAAKREKALAVEVLITKPGDEVPARLYVNDEPAFIPVKVRLKGDTTPDHLGEYPWSLRITPKKGSAVLGMRKFSILKPLCRHGYLESLLLRQMRFNGVLAPEQRFVYFSLNDLPVNVVILEEHLCKELIESQGRRDSVVMAFDEDNLWRQHIENLKAKKDPKLAEGPMDIGQERSSFKTFQEKIVFKSPFLTTQYREALQLLRGYRYGYLNSSEIFDMYYMAKYHALISLWQCDHSALWRNIRFYYNPITRLFEPFNFDNNLIFGSKGAWFVGVSFCDVYSSEEYQKTVRAMVERFIEETKSGALIDRIAGWEKELIAQVPEYFKGKNPTFTIPGNIEKFKTRAPYLKDKLGPLRRIPWRGPQVYHFPVIKDNVRFPGFLLVYYIEDGERTYLEFFNTSGRKVKLIQIALRTKNFTTEVTIPPQFKIISPNIAYEDYIRIDVPPLGKNRNKKYIVSATLNALNANQTFVARRYQAAIQKAKYQTLDPQFLKSHYSFIQCEQNKCTIPAGDWNFDDHLVIPVGHTLYLSAGTTLRFASGKRLVVRGAIQARGTAQLPILLTAASDFWSGCAVLNARDQHSLLEHVIFEKIREPREDDWMLTGAVTFHESPIQIRNCTFRHIKAEDGLNIVRSQFTLTNTVFDETESDALDIDFGIGKIMQCTFTNIQGDAIDTSGSTVTATHITLRNIFDKGISVGERSVFFGQNISIAQAGTAIASKDQSFVTLRNSNIQEVAGAVYMAYQKKAGFGPSKLKIFNTSAKQYKKLAICQHGSNLWLEGEKQPEQALNVKALYQSERMKKDK